MSARTWRKAGEGADRAASGAPAHGRGHTSPVSRRHDAAAAHLGRKRQSGTRPQADLSGPSVREPKIPGNSGRIIGPKPPLTPKTATGVRVLSAMYADERKAHFGNVAMARR
jgi:hypothetical protein